MADVLEPLMPPSELYEYRRGTEGEVPGWLPYAQGDVFEGVLIPGIAEDGSGLAMLFMHPCTMREGAVLRELVTVVAVEPVSSKKVLSDPGRWANRNKVMPPGPFGQR